MDRTAIQNEMKPYIFNNTPVNCKQYYLAMCDNVPAEGMFGIKNDRKPFEGKIIHRGETAILVKVSRNKFIAVDADLVTIMPSIGDTVKVTPYARKQFDGTRTDAPIIEKMTLDDGRVIEYQKTIIGSVKTELPIPHGKYACNELSQMIEQIESLPAPDGYRSISQMLYDAGAKDFEIVDPSPENIIKTPPRIRFTVDNRKHSGQVDVIYDRGMDTYRVELLKNGEVTESISDVYFDDLGSILGQAVDDGSWNKIEIEILKTAKKRALH